MQLEEIVQGKVCPYCLRETELVDSSVIYGTSYGMIYLCRRCDAYVGCHKGTNKSKGSLANPALRRLRNKAHKLFDPLWKAKMQRDNCSQTEARNAAYNWLSKQLGIKKEFTHIGMFDEAQCQQVIELCSIYYKHNKN